MDLELNWERTGHFVRLQDICISQEETQELIVSDANPDIREIVEAGGQLFLTETTVQDGGFSGRGSIEGWVLYRSEEDGRLCRMEVRMPISVHDSANCSANCKSVVRPILCRMDARTLNPRKVLVRAEVCVDVQLYEPKVFALCSGILCDEAAGVQQMTVQHTPYLITQVREKAFSVYEEVRLPTGMDGAGEITCSGVRAWCSETKLIGNKLVFKGEACVRLRHSNGGCINSATIPISFSQVMELEGVGEHSECGVEVHVAALTCARAGEDLQMLTLSLELVGQAVVCEQMSVEVLQDAYATKAQMDVESELCPITELLSTSTKPQAMRELLETEVQAKSVVDADIRVCRVNTVRQGDTTAVQAQLQADVLYQDEQECLHGMSRTIIATGQLEIPNGAVCKVACACPGDVFAAIAADGIELRFNLEFCGVLTRLQPAAMIKQATLSEYCRDGKPRPSAVLRMPLPGERLWDIAKAYGTTMEHICQANALEEADLPSGRMLLIPSGC